MLHQDVGEILDVDGAEMSGCVWGGGAWRKQTFQAGGQTEAKKGQQEPLASALQAVALCAPLPPLGACWPFPALPWLKLSLPGPCSASAKPKH